MCYICLMSMIEKLKVERVKHGLSQQDVAQAMGTTQSALSRAERDGNPTQDFLQRYADALRKLSATASPLEIATIRIIVGRIAKKYGLAEVYLYGSFARGEADSDSDVDLLYVAGADVRLGLMEMSDMKDEFEQALGRTVSLTSLTALRRNAENSRASRRFYEHIQPDMVQVA